MLINGVCGQLGHDCANATLSRGYIVVGPDLGKGSKAFDNNKHFVYREIDITEKNSIR